MGIDFTNVKIDTIDDIYIFVSIIILAICSIWVIPKLVFIGLRRAGYDFLDSSDEVVNDSYSEDWYDEDDKR